MASKKSYQTTDSMNQAGGNNAVGPVAKPVKDTTAGSFGQADNFDKGNRKDGKIPESVDYSG